MLRRVSRTTAAAAALVIVLAGPAWAVSATDVQANSPQVADQPSSDSTAKFPTNKQNEPTIAVNPDGTHLIAGSNDEQEQPPCGPGDLRGDVPGSDCSFFPGIGTDGVYTSPDGGKTWTNQGLLDDQVGWKASPFVSDGDPVIVYGPRYLGRGEFSTISYDAYYQSLASYKPGKQPGQQGPEFIVVSKSSDDGASWAGPSVVADSHGYIFNDKNAMWADRTLGSPYFGRLYASWTQFRSIPGTAEPVMFSYSTDGGRTWSRPNQLSGASNNSVTGGRQGSAIRSDGAGNVYVAWEEGGNQVYARSRNGGVTFERTKVIGPVTDIADPMPGANFRTNSFLSLASEPVKDSTRLYASWVNRVGLAGTTAEVVVYRTDGGTWTKVATPYTGSVGDQKGEGGAPFYQGLDVAPDGRVDLAWQAMTANSSTFGTGNAAIDSWYSSSPAGGEAFSSEPARVSTASSDPAASAQNNLAKQFWGDYNTLVSGAANAWFIYTDSRNGVGCGVVDTYQHELATTGTGTKPSVATCDGQFGNTDAYVSLITP